MTNIDSLGEGSYSFSATRGEGFTGEKMEDHYLFNIETSYAGPELMLSLFGWLMVIIFPLGGLLEGETPFLIENIQAIFAVLINEPVDSPAGFFVLLATGIVGGPMFLGGMAFSRRAAKIQLYSDHMTIVMKGMIFVKERVFIPLNHIKTLRVNRIDQGSRYDEGGILYVNSRRYKLSLGSADARVLEATLNTWLERAKAARGKSAPPIRKPFGFYPKLIAVYFLANLIQFGFFVVLGWQDEARAKIDREAKHQERLELLNGAREIFENESNQYHLETLELLLELGGEAEPTMRELLNSDSFTARKAGVAFIAQHYSPRAAFPIAGEFMNALMTENKEERKAAAIHLLDISPYFLFSLLQLKSESDPKLTFYAALAILETDERHIQNAKNVLAAIGGNQRHPCCEKAQLALKEIELKKD